MGRDTSLSFQTQLERCGHTSIAPLIEITAHEWYGQGKGLRLLSVRDACIATAEGRFGSLMQRVDLHQRADLHQGRFGSLIWFAEEMSASTGRSF